MASLIVNSHLLFNPPATALFFVRNRRPVLRSHSTTHAPVSLPNPLYSALASAPLFDTGAEGTPILAQAAAAQLSARKIPQAAQHTALTRTNPPPGASRTIRSTINSRSRRPRAPTANKQRHGNSCTTPQITRTERPTCSSPSVSPLPRRSHSSAPGLSLSYTRLSHPPSTTSPDLPPAACHSPSPDPQPTNSPIQALTANKSIHHISTAIHASRPSVTDIVPGSPLRHFLYKSRGNVQFLQPSYAPYFPSPLSRRQLLTLYARLHATLHARPAGVKIMHQVGGDCIALAWSTPLFELYAVAPVSTSRQALAQGAMRVVQWVRREEERVFIIGGAVF